jgi:hypothetical protein
VRRWRTKAVKALIANCACKNLNDAIVQTVSSVKKAAEENGLVAGFRRPYDPTPIALAAGASSIRPADLGFDGHVIHEDGKVVVEYDAGNTSIKRRRFTIAHEAGHLILWRATGEMRKMAARKTALGSEIEEVCNKIAAEILAPRDEIRADWRRLGSSSASAFILQIARDYDLSLNFSALRFKEVCAPNRGVALLNLADRCFDWAHGIELKTHLLRGMLQIIGRSSTTSGTGSYSKDTASGISLIRFEWHRFSEHRALVLTG